MRAGPLELTPVRPEDVDELWPLLSDPRLWDHEPESVHPDPSVTRAYLERAAARWAGGLSYWTVRLAATGEAVGSGGAQHHTRGGADHWNLNYRIAADHQGRGYAGLLLGAALGAAHEAAPGRPCVAWIDAHNPASIAVARRAGLRDLGLRHNPADRPRLAWADRDLDGAVYPPVDAG